MLPELSYKDWHDASLHRRLPESWRSPLAMLMLLWGALFLATAREWGEMFHQWWNIDTYTHILLIPPLLVWLVSIRGGELMQLRPAHWSPGLAVLALALAIWLTGRITAINLLAHIGAVGALQASLLAVLGPRIVLFLFLPISMMVFLVPFGDEIIPVLQSITADIAIFLTRLSGVSAGVEGLYIYTPVGLFVVAEECSGVKFLVAMVTLGVLVAFTAFSSWKRRAVLFAACLTVPILANGIRAWGTIYIAQSQGIAFAEGFDHIFYGWIFFAVVVILVLGAAWPYFERDPEEAGFSREELAQWEWLRMLETHSSTQRAVLGGLGLVLSFALIAIYAAPGAT